MTNIFPMESLRHFLEGDYSDEVKKKVKQILNAQQNYEARDLQLSLHAKLHPELILYQFDKDFVPEEEHEYLKASKKHCIFYKRVLCFNNKVYPFKQSSPHSLVSMFKECLDKQTTDGYSIVNGCKLDYHNGSVIDLMGYHPTNRKTTMKINHYMWKHCFFFCSKKYTEETGIKPKLLNDYDECVNMYIDYIKWKVM